MPTLSESLLVAIVVGLAVLSIQLHRYRRPVPPVSKPSTWPPTALAGDTLRSPPHAGRDPVEPEFDVYAWAREKRIRPALVYAFVEHERIPSARVPEIEVEFDRGLEEPANDSHPDEEYSAVWHRPAGPLQVRSLVETLPPKRRCTNR